MVHGGTHFPLLFVLAASPNSNEKAEPVYGKTPAQETVGHSGRPRLSSGVVLMVAAGPELLGTPFHVPATWREICF